MVSNLLKTPSTNYFLSLRSLQYVAWECKERKESKVRKAQVRMQTPSLSALIEADGVTLRGPQAGERYGPCPRCGGRDRFHVRHYNGREWWFCRQCHPKRGDAVDYLRWAHGMTYGEALRALGAEPPARQPARRPATTPRGIVIPDHLDEAPPTEWQAAMSALVERCAGDIPGPVLRYLRDERGLSDDTIRRYRIGYNPRGQRVAGQWWIERGITIPTAYAGHLWRVNVRRRADDMGDGRGKYIAAMGSRAQLFGGDALADPDVRTVIVCAGEFDAMLAQQHAPAGVACVTYGSEAKRPGWEFDYLTRDRRVIVAFDNDRAGDQYRQAWLSLGEQARVPTGKDITDFWRAGGNLGAWLTSLVACAGDDNSEFESAVLAWLESKGYEPRYSELGHIVAMRDHAGEPAKR